MVRPFSLDLWERVVASVAGGRTCRATAALFGVSGCQRGDMARSAGGRQAAWRPSRWAGARPVLWRERDWSPARGWRRART